MSHTKEKSPTAGIPVGGIDFKFFYVSEVAAMLRTSSVTIYKLIHEGKLEAVKIGHSWKIPKSAITRYIRSLGDYCDS